MDGFFFFEINEYVKIKYVVYLNYIVFYLIGISFEKIIVSIFII